jgi:hypothetical protein
MQNNNSKLNTVLLVILIIIASVCMWKLMDNDEQIVDSTYETETQNNQNEVVYQEDVSEQPSPVTPKPIPTPTPAPQLSPLATLHLQYKNGAIAECDYNGNKVYVVSPNAYDAGGAVYNTNGIPIGPTGYFPTKPQGYVDNLKNCKDIYVVSPNIWGKAAVNVYNL